MRDEMKPDDLEKGTPEYAIVEAAYNLAWHIKKVKQSVSEGDATRVRNTLAWLKDSLTRIKKVTRKIEKEMKRIEDKQVLGPTDMEAR